MRLKDLIELMCCSALFVPRTSLLCQSATQDCLFGNTWCSDQWLQESCSTRNKPCVLFYLYCRLERKTHRYGFRRRQQQIWETWETFALHIIIKTSSEPGQSQYATFLLCAALGTSADTGRAQQRGSLSSKHM